MGYEFRKKNLKSVNEFGEGFNVIQLASQFIHLNYKCCY